MGKIYQPQKIESKWQKYWEKEKLFAAEGKSSKPKYYCLIEFPYPSGEGLHVGHPRSYIALDILARKRRLEGYNVLYPIGFDAFGLPSENYAIKTGVHPAITTEKNIKTFTIQLKSLGLGFDWDRQVVTTDPKYYKWTQWIFLKMFEQGLAYKSKIPINWCPSCQIGLANEEVVNGKCERCGEAIEKREKEQWLLKITQYADRLIDDLDQVDYLERIKTQQINWIGRSEGAMVKFQIPLRPGSGQANSKFQIEVFTTRPDTLFGATFMVLAPEHELISNLPSARLRAGKSQISNLDEVENYINRAKNKSDLERTELAKEKTGVELKGIYAVNPVNQKKIPVFIADYVLISYGTGAIMAVPAHDQRDFEFAKKYNLPIVEVIKPATGSGQMAAGSIAAYEDIKNGVMVNSGRFTGLSVEQGIAAITKWLKENGLGRPAVNYKLRDWVFSRQRYWGEPIPLVFCPNCKKQAENSKFQIPNSKFNQGELLNPGWVVVPESQLPVTLPEVKNYQPTATGESPLAAITKWVNTKCPKCGGPATRETDTMPNWAGSNWYFLRYVDPKNNQALADKEKIRYWLPVDWYNGGMEHTTLHLLYSRFVYKFLSDIGVVPKECGAEPYQKRTSHGLVLGEGGEKMSKSKGNVINPDDIVKEFGADTFRLYEMFMGPFDQPIPWDTQGVKGVRRFLEKVWEIYQRQETPRPFDKAQGRPEFTEGRQSSGQARDKRQDDKELISLLHRTIKKVGDDIETQDYNTAVSAMMIFINKVLEEGRMTLPVAETFLKILAPFAPHFSEELWQNLGLPACLPACAGRRRQAQAGAGRRRQAQAGHKDSIFKQSWPTYNEKLAKAREIDLIIQINGKVRDKIKVDADINAQRAETLARQSERVKKYLEGKIVRNVIFVPSRLINFVVE